MPRAGAGAWDGAGERAGAGAVAITRAGQGAVVVAVIELRAGDGALAGAVFLIVVPGPGWRWGALSERRGDASWNALGGVPVTAGRSFLGLLEPFIQLPLGRRRGISLKRAQKQQSTKLTIKHTYQKLLYRNIFSFIVKYR